MPSSIEGHVRLAVALIYVLALGSCLDFSSTLPPHVIVNGAPIIVRSQPASGASAVALDGPLTITFDHAMDETSVVVTIAPAVTVGAPVWDNAALNVSLTLATLQAGTTYSVGVSGRSASAVPLAADSGFAFTTAGVNHPAPVLAAWGLSAFATSDNTAVPITAPTANPWPNDAAHNAVTGVANGATLTFRFNVPVVDLVHHLSVVAYPTIGGQVPCTLAITPQSDGVTYVIAVSGGSAGDAYAVKWMLDAGLVAADGGALSTSAPVSGFWRVTGQKIVPITSTPFRDGAANEGAGEYLDRFSTSMKLGDIGCLGTTDGYVSFAFSAVQQEFLHLDSALLAMHQLSTAGQGTPYTTLGSLKVDPINLGTDFDSDDQVDPLDADCATASNCDRVLASTLTDAAPTLLLTENVAFQLQDTTRSASEFRLIHKGGPGDGSGSCGSASKTNYSQWTTGDAPSDKPTLTLTYEWLGPPGWPQ